MNASDAKKILQTQLNGGASSLVLLAVLHSEGRAMYGYELARELERRHGNSLPMKPGALYPVLRSLEKQGLLSSFSKVSDEGRARKYYKLTNVGHKSIALWLEVWEGTKHFIDSILEYKNDRAIGKRSSTVSKKTRKSINKRAT